MGDLRKHILEIGAVLPVQIHHAALSESDKPWGNQLQTQTEYKLLFVRKGLLQIRVEDERFDLEAGQALLILPTEASYWIHPSFETVRFYFAFFTVEGAGQSDVRIGIERLTTVKSPDRMTALFHLLIDNQTGQFADTPALRLLFLQILAETTHVGTPVPIEASSALALVERGKTYIRKHFAESLTTATIASALDVNPHYFGRLFCRHAGMSLTEFIAVTRTYSARVQLVETDAPIQQIAKGCGFEDAAYFSRVFRKREGMSPRAYRHLHAHSYAY